MKKRATNQQTRTEIAESQTQDFLKIIETTGSVVWDLKYDAMGGRPVNITGRPYQSSNILPLLRAQITNTQWTQYWGTYQMIQANGGHIRRGEKSQAKVFKWVSKHLPHNCSGTCNHSEVMLGNRRVLARNGSPITVWNIVVYALFNSAQAEWSDPTIFDTRADVLHNKLAQEVVDKYLEREHICLFERGLAPSENPHYNRNDDTIHLPPRNAFEHPDVFYSTLFHELAHSTNNKKLGRLDRSHLTYSNHADRGVEEMTAEMCASFISQDLGLDISTRDNSQQYVKSWAAAVDNDPEMVFTASSYAFTAMDFIFSASE